MQQTKSILIGWGKIANPVPSLLSFFTVAHTEFWSPKRYSKYFVANISPSTKEAKV